MKEEVHIFRMLVVFVFTWLTLIPASNVHAFVPPPESTVVLYICPNFNKQIMYVSKENYIKNTLPNEWVASWNSDALRAGAVIIRSGVYWRVNRTENDNTYPNNNCHDGVYCFWAGCYIYHVKAPFSRGGDEEFIANSSNGPTNTATDATFQYHAETVNLRLDLNGNPRPDKLIPLRYGSGIQNRTNDTTGSWLQRIWYAYTGAGHPGSPVNPNQECNQTDTWTRTSDPVFPNY